MKHIEQKLVNWGEWMRRRQDNGLGFGNSPMARLMGASARVEAGSSVPVDEIEASKTDSAVQSLPRNLRQYADLWFVQQLPVREVARKGGCGTATVQVRIDQVVLGVARWFEARQQLIEQAKRMSEKKTISRLDTKHV